MSFLQKHSEKLLLVFILLVATLLRFWNFTEIPFVQDELSTIVRTNFSTIWEVISQAYYTDVHPVGVQLLVYGIVSLFGYSFWLIKLPFLLAGVSSIYLVYRLGKNWFSPEAGLLSAAFLTVIQYHVMYSQSIRPYGIGTFLILCLVWFWSEIVLNQKWKKQNQIGLVLFAFLAYSTHYFAHILGGIILLSGFAYIPKEKRKKWALLVGITILAYLPQLPIFIKHLLFGTPGEWLAAPNKTWIWDYTFFIFHFSWIFLLGTLIIVGLGLASEKTHQNTRLRVTLLFWFLFPLILGYAYSVLRSPMLQFSVVLFGFPFLILVIFSFHGKWKFTPYAVLGILLLGSYTLVYGRQYYQLYYSNGYDEPYIKSKESRLKLQEEFPFVMRSSDMVKFYIRQKHGDLKNALFVEDLNDSSFFLMNEFLRSLNSSRLGLAIPWSTKKDWVAQYRIEYPYLLDVHYGHLKKYVLLSKRKEDQAIYPIVNDTVMNHQLNGKSVRGQWNLNSGAHLETDSVGHLSLLVSSDLEFPGGFSAPYSNIISHPNQLIDIQLKSRSKSKKARLVLEIKDPSGEMLAYETRDFSERINNSNWVVMRFEPGKSLHQKAINGHLNIYLWNESNESLQIQDFGFTVRKENPFTFWLLENYRY